MKKILLGLAIFFSINKINGMDDTAGIWKFNWGALQGLEGTFRKKAIQDQCNDFKTRSKKDIGNLSESEQAFRKTGGIDYKEYFFTELQNECDSKFPQKNYSEVDVNRFKQQKNHLINKVKQKNFPLIGSLVLIKHWDYLNDLDHKITTRTEKLSPEVSSQRRLHTSIQGLKNEYATNLYVKSLKQVKMDTLDMIATTILLQKKVDSKPYNERDNNAYYEQLLFLEVMKKEMEYNLGNVSWSQWLWNYTDYRSHQKSLSDLNNEIALFKDQDRVVSPEKAVLTKGIEVSQNYDSEKDTLINATNGKKYWPKCYTKPNLTHREVFTRSRMPRRKFEQVIAARE